jgi:radical SAM superfamily enzyme YgiQ (UPF0313 family)
MKIYFHETKYQNIAFTNNLLRFLCSKNKIEVVDDAKNSDLIFVSLIDVSLIKTLVSAKKYNKPIITGGDVAKIDMVKYLADFVVKGEAFKFIERLLKVKSISEIEEIENVTTIRKDGVTDYDIDYNSIPIVRSSEKVYYIYGGKGCQMKCAFCFYSHVNKYSCPSENYIKSAAMKIPKAGKLFVTSAYFPYPKMEQKYLQRLGMIDLKIRDYLNGNYKNRSFRIGIEFMREENRKKYGKPIPDSLITELVNKSQQRNQELVLYMLAGIESDDDVEHFVSLFPFFQESYSPRIMIHFQYIDFNELTPIAGYDVRLRKTLDVKRMQRLFNVQNRRVRVADIAYMARSTYRTLVQRCTNIEEINFILKLSTEKNNDIFLEKVEQKYPKLLGVGDVGTYSKII